MISSYALSPPDWLERAATAFITHVAEPMFWFLAAISFLTYIILLWQKRRNESMAAQALRWLQPAKMCVWLSLALSHELGAWRYIAWAFAVWYVTVTGVLWLIGLYVTYIRPARRNRTVSPDRIVR